MFLLRLRLLSRSFNSSVTAAIQQLSCSSLSFSRFVGIDVCKGVLRCAISAEVDVWHFLAVVVALDVLPCIALFAKYRVAVIVIIAANTFYCVFFFVCNDWGREFAIWYRRD